MTPDQKRLLDLIPSNCGRGTGELAAAFYGEDSPRTRDNLRTIMKPLLRLGLVDHVGWGLYQRSTRKTRKTPEAPRNQSITGWRKLTPTDLPDLDAPFLACNPTQNKGPCLARFRTQLDILGRPFPIGVDPAELISLSTEGLLWCPIPVVRKGTVPQADPPRRRPGRPGGLTPARRRFLSCFPPDRPATLAELAQSFYGDASPTTVENTRGVLRALTTLGLAEKVDRGLYRRLPVRGAS